MPTMLKLGPKDHGRELTDEEFETADYKEGHKYEIIDGRLFVSPVADQPHDLVNHWVFAKLLAYSQVARDIVGYVSFRARTFVQSAARTTAPEPDVTAFREPPPADFDVADWRDMTPILAIEVLGEGCFDKDMVRNVDLYLRIPSIQEYWVFDIRESANRPTMIVHRRRAGMWRTQAVAPGGSYTTRLLPGFRLTVDPHH